MVDREALSARLARLEEYLVELRRFAGIEREKFIADPSIHHLAERYLHLACECVLDTVHHLIADLGLRQPTSYRDAVDVLLESGQIERDLADRLKAWMGFRNILVHFYLAIDHGRVHEAIVEDLGDLEEFVRKVAIQLRDPGGRA